MACLPLRFPTIAATALCIVSGCAVSPSGYAQSPSTFPNTCENVFIDGPNLVATCQRVDGSLHRTSITLGGIENVDGQLQFTQPGQAANFQDSCRHVRVTGSTIIAACRRLDGSYNRTSINLPGISNIDGNLQFAPSS